MIRQSQIYKVLPLIFPVPSWHCTESLQYYQQYFLSCTLYSHDCFFKDFIYLFLERGERRKRGKETSICVASHVPPTGNLAHIPGMYALTGNWNSDFLFHRPMLNSLSYTTQGINLYF